MATPKKEPEKRLADELGGATYEGEKIKLADIKGQDVILVDFKFGQSKFHENREFIMMQLEVDGELVHASNASRVLVDLFHRIEGLGKDKKLPAPVIFVMEKSEQSGREYWAMR